MPIRIYNHAEMKIEFNSEVLRFPSVRNVLFYPPSRNTEFVTVFFLYGRENRSVMLAEEHSAE
jgi:hypothetical protein